ncbi:MAG TPA: isoaspartyl peptidase/L-asparaginase [Saprospiraceae bacterium]|nr:isoaspartyl peptidase/L-asparaginase [Saprospiraceae bacterium]HNG90302.1 isoaspartyl peptidase/L-asparaginase [Saprospiraceae bacterium]
MRSLYLFLCLALMIVSCQTPSPEAGPLRPADGTRPAYALVIHGGAGTISRADMSAEKEAAYRAALDTALSIGENVLRSGGSALDAVSQTIVYLEDCPLFNAGRGAVFTHEGKNELDASIMDGREQRAGAVGSVSTVKNPILLARAVMERSPHVMLSGRGAEQFAVEQGLQMADPSWFRTEERWNSLQKALEAEKAQQPRQNGLLQRNPDGKFGTVGCAALDQQGNLAAGTSTGGMTNKRWNRLGDSPIIGAGTYASNDACAISCTGHGEYFIRYAVAHDVWALMAYKGLPLQEAATLVVNKKLVEKGGEGGLIGVDRWGNITMPFNSGGMYRGYAKPGGERRVMIWQD